MLLDAMLGVKCSVCLLQIVDVAVLYRDAVPRVEQVKPLSALGVGVAVLCRYARRQCRGRRRTKALLSVSKCPDNGVNCRNQVIQAMRRV